MLDLAKIAGSDRITRWEFETDLFWGSFPKIVFDPPPHKCLSGAGKYRRGSVAEVQFDGRASSASVVSPSKRPLLAWMEAHHFSASLADSDPEISSLSHVSRSFPHISFSLCLSIQREIS